VATHYHDLLEPAGISAYEYLDKIIQIPFRIPPPTGEGLAMFLKRHLPQSVDKDNSRIEEIRPVTTKVEGEQPSESSYLLQTSVESDQPRPEVSEKVQEIAPFSEEEADAFDVLIPLLKPNPRHLKRLVNIYRLVRTVAEDVEEAAILENRAATIVWVGVVSQWPDA